MQDGYFLRSWRRVSNCHLLLHFSSTYYEPFEQTFEWKSATRAIVEKLNVCEYGWYKEGELFFYQFLWFAMLYPPPWRSLFPVNVMVGVEQGDVLVNVCIPKQLVPNSVDAVRIVRILILIM